ncbi:SDR family NAD(P)-dependent oxidoreductase [Halomarina halobia]|uniref:SDR family NAD(P)-dependent oxidoreductase n=1 Tax=Halomarina halobia TaxID=3033386 RepID=A0ABD6AG13_9EURY|nr:SDR family oxidoreductase [Halomarina sp. PSR21]
MNLSSRTVLVTGGSAGIGRAIALAAADRGANVVVADIRREPRESGRTTVEEVEARGQRCTYVEADVTEYTDLERAVEAGETFGGVDAVVNNAGFAQSFSLTDTERGNWAKSIETNLTGVYHGCLAGVARMLEGDGGAIVNIASGAGVVGLVNTFSYSAAKGGVIALTRQIAVDYADQNIRANSVSPGFTDTELFRNDTHDGTREYAERRTPMRRVGEPDEIANAVVFLLSDAASFITGENLLVDGGYAAQ